jgi:hypothetical protein
MATGKTRPRVRHRPLVKQGIITGTKFDLRSKLRRSSKSTVLTSEE